MKADRSVSLILELLDQMFSGSRSNLPRYSSFEGARNIVLRELGRHQKIDQESIYRLSDAVITLDTRLIRKEFEDNLPGLLEKCLEFYLSRSDVRNSLGYTSFVQPNSNLPYWVGQNAELPNS